MMSLLNYVAFLALVTILAQDGLAIPPPPIDNPTHHINVLRSILPRVHSQFDRIRAIGRPRTGYEFNSPTEPTLPQDLLDVPLAHSREGCFIPRETKPEDTLPVDDPIEPEPNSLKPQDKQPKFQPNLIYPPPVYPVPQRVPEAKVGATSGQFIDDPVLKSKLKIAHGEVIRNFEKSSRSDLMDRDILPDQYFK